MESTQMTSEMASLKDRLRATWIAGDFGVIAPNVAKGGLDFVERLDIRPDTRLLDVACGTGNTALPAARAGASVTGIDIAPNLIKQAVANAADEGLYVTFEVGDAEDLPYEDESFDVVISMFGAMFAPRPEIVAGELKRVCKSGGLIVMANWTPESFVGQMFKTNARHVPPPTGMLPPVLWGSEEIVRQRFAEGVSKIELKRIPIMLKFDFGPKEVVEQFRQYFGPTVVAFSKLDTDGQEALRSDLETLWAEHNRATDGTTEVESEYLEVRAVRA